MKAFIKHQFIGLLILLTTSQSWSVDHVVELKKAQEWADSFNKDYPILLFNRDEFHFLFLKNNVTRETKEDEAERIKIIIDYVMKKTGVLLSYGEASNFETYLFVLTGSAVALPFFDGYGKGVKHKICAVFANAPNGNARIETERLTGLENKEAYQGQLYDQLTLKEEFEVFYLFSLYHEVSHCLDEIYMPEVYKSYEPSPQGVHLAESFAETLAYLHLTQSLDFNIARSRMLYRTLYSRVVGGYFANNPAVVFGDKNVLATGAVYYLTPVLLHAYTLVSSRMINPIEMLDSQLYELAGQIVEESAVHFRSFTAVVRSMKDTEVVLSEYEELAFKTPELFLKAYSDLISYHTITGLWVDRAFDLSLMVLPEPMNESLELPMDELCKALREDNIVEFLEVINKYREELSSSVSSIEGRKNRYIQLNSLAKTIDLTCSSGVAKP